MAIAIAMMPHVSAFLMIKWSGMLNALGSLGVENIPSISDPELIAALGQQGAHVVGHQILSQGAIITGLMWGAFLAHLIDAKFKEASGFMLVSAAMSSLGIIHSASLHWPSFNGIVGGYLFVGLGILFYSMSTEVERLPDSGDSSETLEVEFSD